MKNILKTILVILAVVVIGVLADTLFIVHQTEQAMILQFGDPKRVITESGLKVKLPFVQNVVRYDKRLLELDPPSEQIILSDQKRLDVDSFTRFRIADALKFYQSVSSETQARSRMGDIINSSVRNVLGNETLQTLLSEKRRRIMEDIQKQVEESAQELGITITDVRIRRADLPDETSKAIYSRMRSEREREAKEFRAEGRELAQQIRARADREETVIIAEASRKAQEIKGEGDREALKVFAEAAGEDTEFYAFYRSMESYRKSLPRENTSMVLSPDSEFFRFFRNLPGSAE